MNQKHSNRPDLNSSFHAPDPENSDSNRIQARYPEYLSYHASTDERMDQMQRPSIQRKPDNSNLSSFSFESETMDLKSLFGDVDDQYTIESLTNATDNHLDSDIYHLEEREQSILKGLKYIFTMSQNGKNFSSFGNDIIQCFYDISQVAEEQIKNQSLYYIKEVSNLWKLYIEKEGWKNHSIATVQEVLDGCILAYSFDCLAIYSQLPLLLKPYLFEEENKLHNRGKDPSSRLPLYSCEDLFGWNPTTEGVPKDMSEMCSKCKKFSTRGSRQCNYCHHPLFILTPYRSLSNALIYSYYLYKIGFQTPISYLDYFKWLPSLRPYRSPSVLQTYMFNDQSYLVTHVVFTLSNWGQMALNPSLFPHEYLYLCEYLPYYIVQNDIHLVGEFMECLHIFGVSDTNQLMIEGYEYLIHQQNEDGTWDNTEESDAYTSYHAIMVACQAMIVPQYKGYGPAMEEVLPLLKQWYTEEFVRHQTIAMPISLAYQDEYQYPLSDWRKDQRYIQFKEIYPKIHNYLKV